MKHVAMSLILLMINLVGLLPGSEPPRQLLHGDSLIGWDYANDTAGWSIADGKLSTSEGSPPLLGGWTLGDFELTMQWKVSDSGAIKLTFPLTPPYSDRIADRYITPEWHLVLREGDSCGQLYNGTRLIAIGKQTVARRDSHSATLRRSDKQLTLVVDDTTLWDVEATDARFGIQLSAPEGNAEIWEFTLLEPCGDPLFNGRDFTGWETDDPPEAWVVENSEIVCTGKGRDYLRTIKDYGNFTLSLDYNLSRGGNSGIGIRTPRGGWPSGDGMELQLYDERPGTPLNRHSTMAIYGNLEPLARAENPGQWNHAVIKAEGNVISAWVNGTLVQHANTFRMPELKHRHLAGWLGLQNHRSVIRFRNITLLPGDEGRGMPAWYAPRGREASQIVLDRLMNTERLSRADGIRSGSFRQGIEKSGRSTLAELQGPGALVEFAALGDSTAVGGSQVAFYFDGEETPRLKCPLRDLERRAPAISEGGLPLLTFLAYEKSLRIELDAHGPAEYRLDYLTFPHDVATHTFRDESSLSRGMLPAISYRHGQMNSGRVRERDPYPQHASGEKTIEPGQSVELLAVEAAGVVDWCALFPANLAAHDDLWIEVTVDGEADPAISAPALLLFPGLDNEDEWPNFVLTPNEGATLRLAMPFARGIRIAGRNYGSSPLAVSCTASVQPPSDEPQSKLRAQYSPDGKAVELQGVGRVCAMVCAAAGDSVLRISADGRSAFEGALRTFLGLRSGEAERGFLAGRDGSLAWRYLLLSPIEFDQSLQLTVDKEDTANPCLVLYYTD